MDMMMIATFGAAYLLGSIPFGLILTSFFGSQDIRTVGSGNIGATNVMRTGNKPLALLTLLLDMGKGAAAIYVAPMIYPHDYLAVVGLFAVLGHVFPFWLGFKGGKGVATTIGVLLALNLKLAIVICAVWLLFFIFTRTASLASLLSIGWSAVIAYTFHEVWVTALCLVLAILIVYTHRGNIKRLQQGTEHIFSVSEPEA
jgi:acyl phosphate:glycerol-3-phosphate acyltransferase